MICTLRTHLAGAALASCFLAGGPVAPASAQVREIEPVPPPSNEKVVQLLAPFPGDPERWLYPGAKIVTADAVAATKGDAAKLWLTLETMDSPDAVQRYYGTYLKELDPKTTEVTALGSKRVARTDDATVVISQEEGSTTISIGLTAKTARK